MNLVKEIRSYLIGCIFYWSIQTLLLNHIDNILLDFILTNNMNVDPIKLWVYIIVYIFIFLFIDNGTLTWLICKCKTCKIIILQTLKGLKMKGAIGGLQFSLFGWMLPYLVKFVFKNFFFTDATDRSKISSDQKHLFFTVCLYPLSFFANTPFKLAFHVF